MGRTRASGSLSQGTTFPWPNLWAQVAEFAAYRPIRPKEKMLSIISTGGKASRQSRFS